MLGTQVGVGVVGLKMDAGHALNKSQKLCRRREIEIRHMNDEHEDAVASWSIDHNHSSGVSFNSAVLHGPSSPPTRNSDPKDLLS